MFVDALLREIELSSLPLYGSISPAEPCETVYFGGGTPSLLEKEEISRIIDALRRRFSISPDAEITFEANPDDITAQKLELWQQLGINRLSVGVQSFLEAELRWMNRAHNAADAIRCIKEIRAAGFGNYSVDLIYGSPLLDDKDWQNNVSTLVQMGVPHMSCYALTVEPGTALDKMISRHQKAPVDPERQARQFLLLMDWMEQAGYEQYEISNFALPGMRSKHNSSYWEGKKYHGFGPSAHSYDGASRRWNISNNATYIRSLQQGKIPFEEELLTGTQQLNEYIMTSLRTKEGLDLEFVEQRFGQTHIDRLKQSATKYLQDKKLMARGTQFILTREGKLFADGIAADLFY